jgi:hypothetical protein
VKLRALLSLGAIVAVGMMGTGVAGASSTPTEYFTAWQTSFDEPATLVAAGPISATGVDEQVTRHRDNFVFADGTLVVKHYTKTTKETYDGTTCVGTYTETGTYVIAKGTGAYAHATGSGRYKVSAVYQGCDHSEPPTSFAQVIQAQGPLTLG